MVANAFNGLNTAAWTGWVFFAVLIGPILIWAYTVSICLAYSKRLKILTCVKAIYSIISPGWFYVPV